MTIGFCYNIKRNLASTDPKSQADAEFDAPETISAISKALESGGHQVIEIEANEEAYLKLYKERKKIDIVFNIAEGYYGDAREAQIPAMCDLLQIPYTHSSTLTNAITLDKTLTKKILINHKIKTPRFQLFTSPSQELDRQLTFPLLLKPNAEGSSKGILNENLVKNETQLKKRLQWLFDSFHEDILAEEFLSGKEFTVALLGNPPQVLPVIEQRLDRLPKKYAQFSSYEVKWLWEDTLADPHFAYDCPAKIDQALKQKIEQLCISTFTVLNCRDCARIDIRLDSEKEPNVLEINTLPGMIGDEKIISYFPIAARVAGLSFQKLVLSILAAACKRYNLRP